MAKGKDVESWGETSLAEMSFDEMMAQGVIDIAEVDDEIAVNQAELVGIPFVLFEWDLKPSSLGSGSYALCRVKTPEGTRIFADGGTGIMEQLERYKNRLMKLEADAYAPLYFHYGLRASNYNKTLDDGSVVQATTYYFDNRKRP